MKLSFQHDKVDSTGKHNDRNFDLSKAPHIDPSMSEGNMYYSYNGKEKEKSFRDIELEFYEKTFGEAIRKQNERNRIAGHSERNKTVKTYFSDKRTRPEDIIIQVGKRGNCLDSNRLWDIAMEYKNRIETTYGNNCKILTMALHVDEPDPTTKESSPHVHIRRVWTHERSNGAVVYSQDGALRDLGVPISNGQEKKHTRQHTFSSMEREMLRTICKEKSVELEPEPTLKEQERARHLSVPEYRKAMKELDEIQLKLSSAQEEVKAYEPIKKEITETISNFEDFLTGVEFQNRFVREIEEARQKSLNERLKTISKILKAEMQRISDAESITSAMSSKEISLNEKVEKLEERCKTLERRNHLYRDFIESHNMGKTFNEEYAKHKEEEREKYKDLPEKNVRAIE